MSYKVNSYPDGSKYVVVDNYTRDFDFKINSYEDLWLLGQIVDVYNNAGLIPNITIPNLIDGQADRRFSDNQPHGLKLVCNFLNGLGANFKIFHPHNPEVVEALIDNVEIIDNSKFIDQVLNQLAEVGVSSVEGGGDLSKNLVLMSSDSGGFKPLMKLCNKINWRGETASASKSRQWVGGKSKLTQILPSFDLDKDILVVDDISVYGGTFKGLSKAIKDAGHQGKLFLAVSHMTIQNLGDDPITNYYNKVFTTNSKFDEYVVPSKGHDKIYGVNPANLKVIKQWKN